MKAMQKVRRGRGFRGLLNYVLERGPVIGGNMTGLDPSSLASEFGQTRRLRPGVEKPVWHNSLRLPRGEAIDPSRFSEIADRFMERLGFSSAHPRVYVLHDDVDGQHIHIVANRIGVDSSLYLGQNENLKATRLVVDLEREHGLTITPGPKLDPETGKIVMPESRRISKDEREMSERKGTPPGRERLQNSIDSAVVGRPSTATFLERLESAGVTAKPNLARTGKMNGFSFEVDGVSFSGSQLGARYKWAALQTRIDFEPTRDREILETLKNKPTNPKKTHEHPIGSTTETNPALGRDGGSDSENGQDFRKLAVDCTEKADRTAGFVGELVERNRNNPEQDERKAERTRRLAIVASGRAKQTADLFRESSENYERLDKNSRIFSSRRVETERRTRETADLARGTPDHPRDGVKPAENRSGWIKRIIRKCYRKIRVIEQAFSGIVKYIDGLVNQVLNSHPKFGPAVKEFHKQMSAVDDSGFNTPSVPEPPEITDLELNLVWRSMREPAKIQQIVEEGKPLEEIDDVFAALIENSYWELGRKLYEDIRDEFNSRTKQELVLIKQLDILNSILKRFEEPPETWGPWNKFLEKFDKRRADRAAGVPLLSAKEVFIQNQEHER